MRFSAVRQSAGAATMAIAIGGLLWGIAWIPLRQAEQAGLSGPWAGITLNLCAFLLSLPLLWPVRHQVPKQLGQLILCGVATGGGMGLFSAALVETEVVRATLLFYLAPLWATIIGLIFLGERLTLSRLSALVLGISGAAILLGIGTKIPLPENAGDWMALASGMAFAGGSLLIFKMDNISIPEQVSAFAGGAALFGIALFVLATLLGIDAFSVKPHVGAVLKGGQAILWGGALFMLLMFSVAWPAKVLSPGRVSLLLMGEILVGAASAALLAGEHLGLREFIGGALIITAGIVEILSPNTPHKNAA